MPRRHRTASRSVTPPIPTARSSDYGRRPGCDLGSSRRARLAGSPDQTGHTVITTSGLLEGPESWSASSAARAQSKGGGHVGEHIEMPLHGAESRVHRVDGDVARARVSPAADVIHELGDAIHR